MPTFSDKSLAHLTTCHPDLQSLFLEVVKGYDCIVLDGQRTMAEQEENVRKGVSKTLDSRHLDQPSNAVDVAPFPLDWHDEKRFYHFAGYVRGVAARMGLAIRWGGDWDRDFDLKDQTFFDLPHFERSK